MSDSKIQAALPPEEIVRRRGIVKYAILKLTDAYGTDRGYGVANGKLTTNASGVVVGIFPDRTFLSDFCTPVVELNDTLEEDFLRETLMTEVRSLEKITEEFSKNVSENFKALKRPWTWSLNDKKAMLYIAMHCIGEVFPKDPSKLITTSFDSFEVGSVIQDYNNALRFTKEFPREAYLLMGKKASIRDIVEGKYEK